MDFGHAISWELVPKLDAFSLDDDCSGGDYRSDKIVNEECQLRAGEYTLYCHDSNGDGWSGGFLEIKQIKDPNLPDKPIKFCNNNDFGDTKKMDVTISKCK